MLKLFQDASVVLQDVITVVSSYENVPPAVAQFGRDLVTAVMHRDPVELTAVLDELADLRARLDADNQTAYGAWDKLEAALKQLLMDLS